MRKQKNNQMDNQNIRISKAAIEKGDAFEALKFIYHADKERCVKEFEKYGVVINDGENDLLLLAELCKSGGDIAGALKDSTGKSIFFSVSKIVEDIRIREYIFNNSNIEMVE